MFAICRIIVRGRGSRVHIWIAKLDLGGRITIEFNVRWCSVLHSDSSIHWNWSIAGAVSWRSVCYIIFSCNIRVHRVCGNGGHPIVCWIIVRCGSAQLGVFIAKLNCDSRRSCDSYDRLCRIAHFYCPSSRASAMFQARHNDNHSVITHYIDIYSRIVYLNIQGIVRFNTRIVIWFSQLVPQRVVTLQSNQRRINIPHYNFTDNLSRDIACRVWERSVFYIIGSCLFRVHCVAADCRRSCRICRIIIRYSSARLFVWIIKIYVHSLTAYECDDRPRSVAYIHCYGTRCVVSACTRSIVKDVSAEIVRIRRICNSFICVSHRTVGRIIYCRYYSFLALV